MSNICFHSSLNIPVCAFLCKEPPNAPPQINNHSARKYMISVSKQPFPFPLRDRRLAAPGPACSQGWDPGPSLGSIARSDGVPARDPCHVPLIFPAPFDVSLFVQHGSSIFPWLTFSQHTSLARTAIWRFLKQPGRSFCNIRVRLDVPLCRDYCNHRR